MPSRSDSHAALVAGLPPEDSSTSKPWCEHLDNHLFRHVRRVDPRAITSFEAADDANFSGEATSGRIGPLRYVSLRMSASHYEQHSRVETMRLHHTVLLQVAGSCRIRSKHQAVCTKPGDFVLINDLKQFSSMNDGPIDIMLILNALPATLRSRLSPDTLVHRPVDPGMGLITQRWLQDARGISTLHHSNAALPLGIAFQLMLSDVFTAPAIPPGKVSRATIETQVQLRLGDPHLSVATLADALCCTTRTLHRVFGRNSAESLSSYIQRQRIEAAARALRSRPAPGSLTEIAKQHGFTSLSHFSTVLRAHFGVAPSLYRHQILLQEPRPNPSRA